MSLSFIWNIFYIVNNKEKNVQSDICIVIHFEIMYMYMQQKVCGYN
jgi:hypothetical protein